MKSFKPDTIIIHGKNIKEIKEYSKTEIKEQRFVTKDTINFLGGEFIIFQDKTIGTYEIKTLLGSCVSVVAYDMRSGLTGVNHYLLPVITTQVKNDFREGMFSLQTMISKMCEYGANKSNIKVKLFGGATMRNVNSNIGGKNIEFAQDWCKNNHIHCDLVDVHGGKGRQISVKNFFIVKSNTI